VRNNELSPNKDKNLYGLYISFGVLLLIAIIVMILKSPHERVFDEIYFYPNIEKLLHEGLSLEYLKNYENQAPGPLFQLFHYSIYKAFNVYPNIILIRLWNFIFFTTGLFIFVSSFQSYSKYSFWISFFSIFSVPFIYPIFMLGLTEAISVFFFAFAFYFFSGFIKTNKLYLLLLFSLFFSLSLLGRQTFLIIFPAFLLIILLKFKGFARFKYLAITFLSLVPLFFFILLWKGLVPPEQKFVSGGSIFSMSVANGVIGLGYFSIMYFLLNPIFKNVKLKIFLILLPFSIFTQFLLKLQFLPFLSFFKKIGLGKLELLYYVFPLLLIWVGFFFLVNQVIKVYNEYKNKDYLNLLKDGIYLLMSFSPFKIIHSFSSMYVGQASLTALHTDQKDIGDKRRHYLIISALLIIGAAGGLHTVYVYYFANG
jgi:hypothetical protein